MTVRTILHVDMDAFFVSVELLRRPELRGQPVIVGGTGDRGVVAAASYEARHYGIHSAMPSTRARRLCPHAVFLPGDHHHYGEVSERVMTIFRSFTPLVEPISLDEAFLDVTGARRLHGEAPDIAAAIRSRVQDEEGLTCSVGVAPNKFLAKLASEAAKPAASRQGPKPGLGVKVVEPGEELAFLHPLPVQALWGVGPKTLEKLHSRGIRKVADLAGFSEDDAAVFLGNANGRHLHRLSRGEDDRPVVSELQPKSVGHEETFARDHHQLDTLQREAVRMADAVAHRLRKHHLSGRTVNIKVRFHDFRTITRSVTFPAPVDTGPAIARAAKDLLDHVDPASGVRLLGVSVTNLVDDGARQLSLEEVEHPGWDDASRAVDDIRRRFGDDAIVPATLRGPEGIRVKRRGDQQWGPGGSGGASYPDET
ncbi:MAG: polymerase [Acidimicrobiaceae bacterium]